MRKILFIVTSISLLNAITLSSVIPIMYVYAISFNLNDFYFGLLFGIFPLAQFFANPILGRLSDIYGRKTLLTISLFGTFVASIMEAMAPNAFFLFLGRFIDGITGGNNSIAQAVIADVTDEKNRAYGFALFGASFGLGFAIGPLITILLSNNFGNQSVFIFSGILALIATIITQIFLPETNKHYEKKKINLIDLLFLQLYKVLQKPILREILILNFVTALCNSLFNIAFQPYILNNFKWGQDAISYILVFIGLLNIFFLRVVKKLLNQYGESKLISVMLSTRIVTFFIISLFINDIAFLVTMLIYGFMNLFIRPTISSLTTKYTKKEDQGVVLGSLESLFSLGLGVGPLFFSFSYVINLLQNQINIIIIDQYSIPFLLISIISFLSYLYWIKFIKDLKYRYNKKELKQIDV